MTVRRRAATLVDTSAAALDARCRRAGRTVRGTVDCLVAAVALEHDLAVLGVDPDLLTLHELCRLRLAVP